MLGSARSQSRGGESTEKNGKGGWVDIAERFGGGGQVESQLATTTR